ncbi:SLC13 family permease [Occultella aeris]|uniref:Citrate transporter n=1 Tax=Occultella aeris TaxID=2761496 RepID=A0A7M4DMV5_9MICO|nr:SLC13 family permease [Occultella aeris]VZO38750.1 Citrate transporter [Occultella aeris]
MDPATITLIILGLAVVAFITNKLPVGVVALLVALALWATGVMDLGEAVGGFGDPVVVFLAALFVVSEGLDSSGVTAWAGQALARRAGTAPRRILIAVMVLCALLTTLLTPNGSVAALLPMVVMLAVRAKASPSQFLMPLAFAAHAGSLLALTGTVVNVIVADASTDAGGGGFGFFEFALIGLPLLAATIAACVILGPRMLPTSVPKNISPDLSRHAETLARQYDLTGGFYRLRLRDQSALVGTVLRDLDLGAEHPGVRLMGAQRPDRSRAPALHVLGPDDVLVIAGPPEQVSTLVLDSGLAVAMRPLGTQAAGGLVTREAGVVEVVVPPRSPLLSERVFAGMQRGSDLVILAVRRRGKEVDGETDVVEGDVLLLHGAWPAIDTLVDDRDVLLVDSPDLLRRQAVPMGSKAPRALAVTLVMVLLLAFGLVPAAVAGLIGAIGMVLLRVVSVPQAYRAVSWQVIVLIGGLIPLSVAITESGAADLIADGIVDLVGDAPPFVLLVALFVLTGTLGQVVSNTATVLIVVPIALAAAAETGYSVQPVLMLVAVAGAASFLTPIATASNMMVMGPGGYRFGSYWRLGLPVMGVWLVLAVLIIPLIWPL